MRLLLAGDDGAIIDGTDEFTREDLDSLTPMGAWLMLAGLNADAQ